MLRKPKKRKTEITHLIKKTWHDTKHGKTFRTKEQQIIVAVFDIGVRV